MTYSGLTSSRFSGVELWTIGIDLALGAVLIGLCTLLMLAVYAVCDNNFFGFGSMLVVFPMTAEILFAGALGAFVAAALMRMKVPGRWFGQGFPVIFAVLDLFAQQGAWPGAVYWIGRSCVGHSV